MSIPIGSEIEIDGVRHVLCAFSADRVVVRDVISGVTSEITTSDFARVSVRPVSVPARRRISEDIVAIEYLPEQERAAALFLSGHLRDLVESLDERDVTSTMVGELLNAKCRQLAAAGHPISLRSLERKVTAYRERGPAGLVDKRKYQESGHHRRVDPLVIAALTDVMAAQTKSSTGTKLRLIELTEELVEQRHGKDNIPLPSRSTFFRLFEDLDRGRMTTGSAKTRRSLSNRPARAYSPISVVRPGEQIQIDSTSLDVLVQLDGGLVDRPELTIMLDVASRSIISAVLRPGATKSVDLVVTLARALVPYSARPEGRAQTRALVENSFESKHLMGDQDLEAYRRRQPYIFPQSITTDRGKIFISRHFSTACELLGIWLTVSAPYTPTDKAKVERTFKSINTGFTQYLKNYTGRGVEFRGVDAEPETLHSLLELQELLDEWIAVVWQNHAHDSLRDPLHPGRALSPNEMFRAYQEFSPQLEIPFDAETYVSLLPVEWRTLQSYGVSIGHRTYDSPTLNPLRRSRSANSGHDGKWAIHVDPYNVQTVWIRIENDLVPLQWAHGPAVGPMSADVWKVTRRSGFFEERKALESDIARRSRDILARGGKGRTRENIAAARSHTVNNDPMRKMSEIKEAPLPNEAFIESEAGNDLAQPRLRFELLNIMEEVERPL